MKKGCILIIGYIFSAYSGTSTLIMEYIVGHTIELVYKLKNNIEAYTVRAQYLSVQRSKLELRLFLLDWK
jgi:hypothetical protein